MNLQKIETLIGKYERGETTLEEELELKIFFAKENVPLHLAGYRELFSFYRKAAEVEMPDPDFDRRILEHITGGQPAKSSGKKPRRLYPALAAAASIVVLFGLYFLLSDNSRQQDTFDDPALAYAETKKILLQVSGNLNDGVEELGNIKEINKGLDDLGHISSFNEGMKSMKKISVLDKSRDMITQKSNKQ
jgi:hypothetical protein